MGGQTQPLNEPNLFYLHISYVLGFDILLNQEVK